MEQKKDEYVEYPKKGDLVVHIEYGISLYAGLVFLDLGRMNEYILLYFKSDEKLYVPIHNANAITMYKQAHELRDGESDTVLTKLGSKSWEKNQSKAIKSIHDFATNLLKIYSQRSIKKGFKNEIDKVSYKKFRKNFTFKETKDQKVAIDCVIRDMSSEKPMDRLICGDVGFGKTEVAIRAAFVAFQNRRQTVVLSPTTILAHQHFMSFQKRFESTGATIELLSGF